MSTDPLKVQVKMKIKINENSLNVRGRVDHPFELGNPHNATMADRPPSKGPPLVSAKRIRGLKRLDPNDPNDNAFKMVRPCERVC